MKRLIPFLILNIIVSAITTLLVLRWWDQNHRAQALLPAPTLASVQGVVNEATPLPEPEATLPSLDEEWIRIDTVIGAGDLNNEVVEFVRVGEGDLRLTGWQVVDEQHNRYTFPDLLLNKNGSVRLVTRAGQNSVVELFWGLEKPVWSSGETVKLLDPEGNVRATYQIP